MNSDAFQNPPPRRRREPGEKPQDRSGGRRPLQRAGAWTREHWRAARARLGQTRLKSPSRKALTWTGAVLGLLVIVIAILIAIWDWNWFRGPLARVASARMHREVAIDGDLKVHLWSWQPGATVDGVRIANPDWADRSKNMADIGRIGLQIRLAPLLGGHLDVRRLEFDQPRVDLLRDAQGRASWDFSGGKKSGEPLRLPPIRDFVINDGKLTYHDVKRRLTFTGTLNASERLGAQNRGFEMRGQGALNNAPFTLVVSGGPLLNIQRDRPYPFNADIRAGQTYVTARGAVPRPFDLGHFYMDATARGPDLAELYGVTGIPLPNTPPYDLRGRLTRNDHNWDLTGVTGRVGSSDLAGRLGAVTGRERPLVTANLTTRSLNFADLGALFGGGKAGKAAAPARAAAAANGQAGPRLLPDATLDLTKIRSVDADVTYRAMHIRNAPVNLSSGSAHVKLNAGVLKADPLAFELPQGRLAGAIQLDARRATPVTDLDLRLTNARLEHILATNPKGGAPFAGSLVGRAKLSGAGDSVHRAFANADGQLMVAVPGGEVRQAFAELLGVNVVKGLGLLLSKDQQSTPIRCGVAHFRAQNGLFTADQVVFDTGPVLVTGSGTVNMDTEGLDLKIQGHPKKLTMVHLNVPVTVGGVLRRPDLGVQPGPAIAQGGVAAALGVFLTPLAAILPFIDPGLAKDANCAGLINEAAQHGAPVNSASEKSAAVRNAPAARAAR